MNRMIAAIALGFGIFGSGHAAIDAHEFADGSQRQHYYDLAAVLRCPKCQNQSIAESSSPIANDLRGEIRRMLIEGKSDKQIIDFMVARYGEFVLYDPPLSSRTVLLWLGPAILLLVGGVTVGVLVRSRRRTGSTDISALSEAEKNRLAKLLQATPLSIEQDT